MTLIAATALVLSFVLTPLWQWMAPRLGVMERPGPRRIHRVPTPTAGGVVVFVSAWTALRLHGGPLGVGAAAGPVLWAGCLVVLLGLLDDLFDLRPSVKLLGQIAAAAAWVLPTAWTAPETLYFAPWAASPWWGGLFAVGWLVAMMNMFNIIDGLDGLATGLATIAAAPLLWLALQRGEMLAAALAAGLVGAGVGFLRYNANPARLFLGDAGGMFLGFALGFVSLQGALSGGQAVAPAVPLLAVGVPLLDTFSAVVRRSRAGRPIARADAQHIHHQLLRHGLGTPRAVGLLYGLGAVLAGVALAAARWGPKASWAALALFGLAAWPWARRLGVVGPAKPLAGALERPRRVEARVASVSPPEAVDFHEETGKFQGVAK